MPVVLIIGIILSAMFIPAAEQLFFQEIPLRITQVQQWEEQTIFSQETFNTIRSVAAGKQSLQEVMPSIPFVSSANAATVSTSQPAAVAFSVPVARAESMPLAVAVIPQERTVQPRVQYEVPSSPPYQGTYQITERSSQQEDPIMAFVNDLVEEVVARTKQFILKILPFSLALCILFYASTYYYSSILDAIATKRLKRWTDHPLPVSLGGGREERSGEAPVETVQPQGRWEIIMRHALSDSPNDWRLAILDADIMLDEMLSVQGYHGDTVADKLKQVTPADFKTLELAWEAHKVRNKIAHEGTSASLDQHEVRRVIGLYQRVFQEFDLLQV